MVRHCESFVRWLGVTENYVASRLMIDLVTEATEQLHELLAAEDWQLGHGTSTNTSEGPGGIGSPRARRLSR